MGIQDILKKSFLAQFDSSLSTTSIIAALVITAVISISMCQYPCRVHHPVICPI